MGTVMLEVESVKANFPSASPTGWFNVSFILGQLPDGVTITFDPARFTISPEKGAQVKMSITVNQDAVFEGEVEIIGRMRCVEIGTGNLTTTSFALRIVATTP